MESQIIHGDCIDEMNNLPDASVDMIITDPPYSTPIITAFGRKKIKNVADLSIQEGYFKMLKAQFERILKPNGRVFIFCNDNFYPSLYRAFYNWLSIQMVVWDKGHISMGKPFRKRHEIILYCNRESFEHNKSETQTHFPTVLQYKPVRKDKLHGAEKPLDLIKDLIKGFSNEGDVILDPFVGSGTAVLACKQLNRIGIGIDLNEEYVEIARKRCALPKEEVKDV